MASLKDIARDIGLSVSVVSRVLNPAPDANARFSAETRKKVLEAAQRLGYRPNVYASSLRKQENRLVLCVVGDVCRHSDMEHLKLLEYELGKRGYNLLVQFLMELPETTKLDFLERVVNMPAGIAIWSLGIREEASLARFRELFKNAPPALSLTMDFPGSNIDYIRIRWGGLSFARAAEFLAQKGYKTIGCCCTQEEYKCSGVFIETAEKSGMEAFVLSSDKSEKNYFERGLRVFKELRKRPALPQAIYCTSDDMAFVFIEEFRAMGLKVPEDIFILGGGDSAYSGYFHDPLPVLVHNASVLCKAAADHLIAKIESKPDCTGKGECVAEIDSTFRETDTEQYSTT